MGTQLSNKGPKDKKALLPKWALPDEGDDAADPEADEEPTEETDPDEDFSADPDDENQAVTNGAEDGTNADTVVEPGPVAPELPRGSWSLAKRFLGKSAGSGKGGPNFGRAARRYVSAKRGARNAARSATSGRQATRRLAGFLADIARRGVDAAMRSLNLSSYVGRDAISMLAAISNALAPDGASPDQAVAREAINDVLEGLYERFVLADGNLNRLDALTIDDIRQAMADCVCSYIYHRWLQELGRKIEEKAISPREAVRLERDVKQFVKDTVILDLSDTDVLAIDWDAADGHRFVDNIYNDAYRFLGNAK